MLLTGLIVADVAHSYLINFLQHFLHLIASEPGQNESLSRIRCTCEVLCGIVVFIFIRFSVLSVIVISVICYALGSRNNTWYNKNTKTVS